MYWTGKKLKKEIQNLNTWSNVLQEHNLKIATVVKFL